MAYECDICNVLGRNNNDIIESDMVECVDSHVMCRKHVSKFIEKPFNYQRKYMAKNECYLKKLYCPICNLKEIAYFHYVRYIERILKKTHSEICDEIKLKFKTYKKFYGFIFDVKQKKTKK
ncbi:MAG: hypothetical protein LBV16_08480 [Elusimicrobiota bacterium]|jgi:hypothetical protein|nr:hypothetical protein [Elusimicrobiota bacterium]